MTNYELCHASYRGNIEKEIDAAHEVLRKYKKSCVDAVKELRYETDMPMTECGNMLRCLQRDAEIERIQVENAKLRELCKELLDLCYDAYEQEWGWDDDWALAYEQAKKLGVEVTK